MRRIAIIGLVFLGVLGVFRTVPSWSASTISPEESARSETAVLTYLLPLLKSAAKVARVDYLATCQSGDAQTVLFPRVDAQPPSGRETGLAAIREIFRNTTDVTVTENDPGIVHIRIGNVPNAILSTRISRLDLDPYDQYDPIQAIRAIDRADEVSAASHQLGIGLANADVPFIGQVVEPNPRLPHLPPSMTGLTMDQALDSVAKTFDVVVLYGACFEPALYVVHAVNSPT